MLEHRWALIEKDHGDVLLVELTALTPDGGHYVQEGAAQCTPLHAILTRSNSRERMAHVQTLFQQAWQDAHAALDKGKASVESLRTQFPPGEYLDREIAAAVLRFHAMRDAAWRQAVDQLRRFPIDPLSPKLSAVSVQ